MSGLGLWGAQCCVGFSMLYERERTTVLSKWVNKLGPPYPASKKTNTTVLLFRVYRHAVNLVPESYKAPDQ
jgi:hypothetical protein